MEIQNSQEYTHQRSIFDRISNHFLWIYIARPLFIAGFFLTLGFALFAASVSFGLAVPGVFLMTELTAQIGVLLAAFSAAVICNWIMQRFHASSGNSPTTKTITAAIEIEKILNRYAVEEPIPQIVVDALLIHIEHMKELPYPGWPSSLNFNCLIGIQIALTRSSEKTLNAEDRKNLNLIVNDLKTNLDPAYKPPFSLKIAIPLVVLSTFSFISCLILLFYIFSGAVAFSAIGWSLSLVALLGFGAWAGIKYFLDHTSGGSYSVWATIFGIAGITTLVLAATVLTGHFILASISFTLAAQLIGISILLLAVCIRLCVAANNYANEPRREREITDKTFFHTWFIERSLIAFKVLLLVGFLFLAFLSMATLFNFTGLGQLGNLLNLAFTTMTNISGGDFETGTKWIGVFSIGIFSTASFIAFELFKNLLERSPASTKNADKDQTFTTASVLNSKLIFIAGIPIAFIALQSQLFIYGISPAILPVFIVSLVIMPLFSINANFPYFKNLNHWWNYTFFGIGLSTTPFHDKRKWAKYLQRELLVLFILFSIPCIIYMAGTINTLAFGVLGIGAGVTLFFRWSKIIMDRYDPISLAQSYLQKPAMHIHAEQASDKEMSTTANLLHMDHDEKLHKKDENPEEEKTPYRFRKVSNSFVDEKGIHSGGKSESRQVTDIENNRLKYQLKRKNESWNPVKRDGSIRANLAEFISMRLLHPIFPYSVPEGNIYYDEERHSFAVTSKYIEYRLDDLDKTHNNIGGKIVDKHAYVVARESKDPRMAIEAKEEKFFLPPKLHRSLADAIAVSALLGDHDPNPGNMCLYGAESEEKSIGVDERIARIDFGQAFNNLLRYPLGGASTLSGWIISSPFFVGKNQILDFLNREEVNSLSLQRQSKLWRYYSGIIPSYALASSLEALAKRGDDILQQIKETRNYLILFIKDLQKENDEDAVADIELALRDMNRCLGIDPSTRVFEDEETNIVDVFFSNLTTFMQNNLRDMAHVAKLMEMQVIIDEIIKADAPDQELLNRFKVLRAELAPENERLEYVRMSKEEEPQPARSVADYINYRYDKLFPRREKAFPDCFIEKAEERRFIDFGSMEPSIFIPSDDIDLANSKEEKKEEDPPPEDHSAGV